MVVVKLDDLVEAIVVVVVVVVFVVFGFCTTLKGFSSVVVSQVVLNEVDTSNAIKIDLKKKTKEHNTDPFFFQCCLGFVHIYLGFLKKSFGTVGVSLLFLATFRTMEQRLYYVARSPRIQQTVRLECTRA